MKVEKDKGALEAALGRLMAALDAAVAAEVRAGWDAVGDCQAALDGYHDVANALASMDAATTALLRSGGFDGPDALTVEADRLTAPPER